MTEKTKKAQRPAKVEKPAQESGGEKGVPVSSLAVLETFKYEGGVYSKRRTSPDGVRALSEKGDAIITLAPDTIVMPV